MTFAMYGDGAANQEQLFEYICSLGFAFHSRLREQSLCIRAILLGVSCS